ncbi:MAG: type I 3-dehydroquinate dehydratase [Oscillospiraceae bacterium]|nr:type I 3-dehydroquinate dehydratase [Oscillospiraceae bacterium]
MSQKTVTVRGVTLGAGIPKICVPLVGESREAILAQAGALSDLPADIVEWRCDWYADIFSQEETADTLRQLRACLGNRPLLMTFRTAAEGGQRAVEPSAYVELLTAALETGCVDLLDVELFLGQEVFQALLTAAHRAGAYVIASNHDFAKTPPQEELIARLTRMQEWGADIAKIAVMPQSPQDVLTLLSATCTMRERAEIPLITMSMSGLGVVSRLAGEVFGSAMTFGAAERASAPGQVEVHRLAETLALLHDAGENNEK